MQQRFVAAAEVKVRTDSLQHQGPYSNLTTVKYKHGSLSQGAAWTQRI